MQPSSTFAALLAAGLALAGCAERSAPDTTPFEDRPVANTARVPLNSSTASEFTEGLWRPDTVEGERAVVFQEPQSEPIFALYCDGRRGIVLERRGLTSSGPTTLMRIVVDGVDRRLAVNPVRGEKLALRAVLPDTDTVTAALKRAPAGISVDVGQGSALRLPPAEIVQMLAVDCGQQA